MYAKIDYDFLLLDRKGYTQRLTSSQPLSITNLNIIDNEDILHVDPGFYSIHWM